jgi:ribonuclease HI
MINEKTIKVWTDGGSSGNPGKGAVAFIIEWDNQRILSAMTLKEEVTSNEAEYKALLGVLIWLLQYPYIEIYQYHLIVYSDSQLVVNQVSGLWNVNEKKFKNWLEKLRSLLSKFQSWEIQWIPREENKVCDDLIKLVLYKKT